MKLPLSAVVIVKNESANIERCLDSVQWADEILVVDSGSSDNTVELAEKKGARVLSEAWRGFGPQKAFASVQAKHDWILSLDADEEVSPELLAEIQKKFSTLDPEVAYALPRKSYFLGRWIMHGGWWPDRQVRLFHRKHSMWNDAKVHEKVVGKKQLSLAAPLRHYVFRNLAHQVETNNRYSSLLAQQDIAHGKHFSVFRLLTKPPFKFFENYILKRGFLDGLPGFIIAVNSAVSIFLRIAKTWELSQKER